MGNVPFASPDASSASDNTPTLNVSPVTVRIIASDDQWIEGASRQQLETAARLAGMRAVIGFPDLHPGKGMAVGAAYVSENTVHPTLAGNDIGCAMSFWATGVSARKLKLDKWERSLAGLDRPFEGNVAPWREQFAVPASIAPEFNFGLGTIGGGNHFAELQTVAEVLDGERFRALGLDKSELYALIHSGSRGLGQAIFREVLETHGANPLALGSAAAEDYFRAHDGALAFAKGNRALIAHRLGAQIGGDMRPVSDVPHNLITREISVDGGVRVVHRKGAADSGCTSLVIPGSRGTPSFLVVPTGTAETREAAGWSVAHGAGRRWQRGYAKSRLSHRYRVEDLVRTPLGGRVICEDRELLYDEAPQAYKDIEVVIADLAAAGLISVVARLTPVLTYKARRRDDE